MHPANKISNLRRRVNRARKFPTNTCGASRHLHLVAECMLRGDNIDPEEREHVAASMLAVLESLWKARTKLDKLAPTYGPDELACAANEAEALHAGIRVE